MHESVPQLIGEKVTISYVVDPSVSYGKFRLENHTTGTVTASVKSVWLKLDEQQEPLSNITVFDLDKDRMVNPKSFTVDAYAIMNFLVGFPRIAYEPFFGESAAVCLRLSLNGTELKALSPIEFVRRLLYEP
ncbi:MAG: hypothetical protein NC238_05295 [Dehalobacter sp.]|nr:hypothetical protein [Dehalobacter sp.]